MNIRLGRCGLLAIFFASLLLVALAIPALAYPAGEQISIGSYKVQKGSVVDVAIVVTNAEGVAGGSVKVVFDKSVVEVQRVLTGDFGAPVANVRNDQGFVYVAVARPEAVRKHEAILAVIEFKGVREGKTTLRVENAQLNDEKGNLLTPAVTNGLIEVYEGGGAAAVVQVGSVEGRQGEALRVPITISNAMGVAGFQFTLTFDPSVAEVREVYKGSLTEGFTLVRNINNKEGWVKVTASSAKGVSGSGEIAVIEVKLVGRPGSSTSLSIKDLKLNDEAGNLFEAATQDGSIKIKEVTPAISPSKPRLYLSEIMELPRNQLIIQVPPSDTEYVVVASVEMKFAISDFAELDALKVCLRFYAKVDPDCRAIIDDIRINGYLLANDYHFAGRYGLWGWEGEKDEWLVFKVPKEMLLDGENFLFIKMKIEREYRSRNYDFYVYGLSYIEGSYKVREYSLKICVSDGSRGVSGVSINIDGKAYKTDPTGIVSVNVPRGMHDIEVAPQLDMSPGRRYVFVGWSDGLFSNRRKLNVTADIVITCYMKLQYSIKITVNPPIVSNFSKDLWADAGSSLELSLPTVIKSGDQEYVLQGWLINGEALFGPRVLLSVNKPTEIIVTYLKRTVERAFYALSDSLINEVQINKHFLSFSVSGRPERESRLIVLLPWDSFSNYGSSSDKLLVVMDGRLKDFSASSTSNGLLLDIGYGGNNHVINIYLSSYVAKISASSIFNLGLSDVEVKIFWPTGDLYTTCKTGPSGDLLVKLPYNASFVVEASYWWQTQRAFLSPMEPSKQFTFLLSAYSLPIFVIVIALLVALLIIFVKACKRFVEAYKRRQTKKSTFDSFAIDVAVKYGGLLSASVLIKEAESRRLSLTLEEANKLLERLVKNKSAIWVDEHGREAVVPSVWKDLAQTDKKLLVLIFRMGKGPERRVGKQELFIASGLRLEVFEEVLNDLERHGYVIYDPVSNEVKLRRDKFQEYNTC
jgi:hypothetical protein